ncbi:hypothetical protein [Hufsiella ginkgonis]|uniref:Uncharacterized protein n=1 Tax=Hufsiella ginkgonis TaxID=2695274 RepID=A0A7K1XV22_9SPHI|nr:hypothetical protein [Hufsiella ginkgonis]MXV14820.1 hypothetical protein [Hufsiella ginkgonis]
MLLINISQGEDMAAGRSQKARGQHMGDDGINEQLTSLDKRLSLAEERNADLPEKMMHIAQKTFWANLALLIGILVGLCSILKLTGVFD